MNACCYLFFIVEKARDFIIPNRSLETKQILFYCRKSQRFHHSIIWVFSSKIGIWLHIEILANFASVNQTRQYGIQTLSDTNAITL